MDKKGLRREGLAMCETLGSPVDYGGLTLKNRIHFALPEWGCPAGSCWHGCAIFAPVCGRAEGTVTPNRKADPAKAGPVFFIDFGGKTQ